jgi:hypothetical protein
LFTEAHAIADNRARCETPPAPSLGDAVSAAQRARRRADDDAECRGS